jgi:NAD-dependent deacetylase
VLADQIGWIRQKLASAYSVTVLTGAGISAESGVPTFRGEEGLWKNFRAEELATPQAFDSNPEVVWEWYHWRRDLLSTKQPNQAHLSLVELEAKIPSFTLITQNVDGLHTLARSKNIIELHGNIWRVRCTGCGHVVETRSLHLPLLPKCNLCLALLRPDVIWFGETLDPINLEKSIDASGQAEIMIVIGTSGMVQPAASFASIAKSRGAFVIEINTVPSFEAVADISLVGRASEMTPQLTGPEPSSGSALKQL